ncbi:hypothetical protein [Rhizobium sp. MHM7A]|uniref:hypothetical protein n=1 Tax=Rhizobium sp. MHM7A TaxID=2583233 RepID=UPI00110650C2|nr:hypothetical protein [Rhizobium sp. MHM7A]TLX16723.1 hypothetical protein FFR93_05110 [Rhizobium sp. MHM7A]
MSFSLHDIGATASIKIEEEIASRKKAGARKLLWNEAERIAKKVAGDAFVVDDINIATLFYYVPQILDQKAHDTETVRESIHRIVVQEALKSWKSTIDWNVAKQHAPYDLGVVVDIVPKALKFLDTLCRRKGYYPEVHIEQNWIGLALLYLEDKTPERLLELERSSVQAVLISLAREIDGIAWSIKDAASPKSPKALEFHKKLLELVDMLYMIGREQIDIFDVSWPQPSK